MERPAGKIRQINAVTLATADMRAAVAFYEAMGFETLNGGADAAFTSFRVGDGFLNLQLDPEFTRAADVWGRVIFYVNDVDETYSRALDAGLAPETPPADAPWGERYFHLRDRDGHELSFARPLDQG
jgi:catechol 2,3-dioxygenase-like lactoylglutathione lyase family enzyme